MLIIQGGSRAVAQLMEKISQENAAKQEATSSPSIDRSGRGGVGGSALNRASTAAKVTNSRKQGSRLYH